jgi:hypothetical protein
MQLFDDALGPPHVSTGQFSLWSDWHGVPKQQVFAKLTTRVVDPVARDQSRIPRNQQHAAGLDDYFRQSYLVRMDHRVGYEKAAERVLPAAKCGAGRYR